MAASAFTHDQLVEAFEARFDYLTARTMVGEILEAATVAKAAAYDAGQLAKISAATEAAVARPQPILSRLSGSAASSAAVAKADAKPAAEPPKAAAAAESTPAKAEAPVKSDAAGKAAGSASADDAAKGDDAAAAADAAKSDDPDKKAKK